MRTFNVPAGNDAPEPIGPDHHIGHRRRDCWWEPTYEPELDEKLARCDWQFPNTTGPQKSYLLASDLKAHMVGGQVYKLNGLTFSQCDFQGTYDHMPSMLFDKCRFHKCDFAFSIWRRVTFRECEFEDCSLALAAFEECEFRDCAWVRIGFTGSKTTINRTFITNPTMLIGAGFSGTDPKRPREKKHMAYQRYRLEGTKAHIARTLLQSHESVGDDKTYYETARLHDLQQTRARIYESLYKLRHGDGLKQHGNGLACVFWFTESGLLRVIGLANEWGSSLLRPLIALLLSFVLFGCLYPLITTPSPSNHPWQMAFDIGTLAGYGNAANSGQPIHLRLLEGAQLIISIFFYTIFLSTAVARFSRSR